MGNKQQPQPSRFGAPGSDAAAELAEIQRRQEGVIKTALVPPWYWPVMAAGLVAIGAARDSHDAVVLAITIPLVVVVIAALIFATIPGVRRRVKVRDAAQRSGPASVALMGLIVLVAAVTVATAIILTDDRVPHPLTISYAAGGVILVIGGPLLNRYVRWLMLSNARQRMTGAPEPRSSQWQGLLHSDPADHAPDHAQSTNGGVRP
jgi:NADH:ubiquinone oxidoreductase subunit 2 (subunit N)